MLRTRTTLAAMLAAIFSALLPLRAADEPRDEWKLQREERFEFAEKPSVSRDGDRTTVRFASEALCDATVAIEDGRGKLVRHLASGVLGPHAPAPFRRDSLRQELVWDGKNDKGEYVTDRAGLVVRVSLGLKPRFERTLYWSPKKRSAQSLGKGVAIEAAPEGVYVFDGGQAVDHLRLFDHQGEYVRTVYPFPAGKIDDVPGLIRHEFPQDGKRLAVKPTYQMCTFLISGDNAHHVIFQDGRYFVGPMDRAHKGEQGQAATDFAVAGERIALGAHRLSRLATDGGSAGLSVYGPDIDIRDPKGLYKPTESGLVVSLGGYGMLTNLRPHRMAFGPDGNTLYLTRFHENYALDMYQHNYWRHGVYRMRFDSDEQPELFLGGDESGSDEGRFFMPADVACDAQGRVLVADMGNHRVQVFDAGGQFLKSIPVEAPAQVAVSPKTGELYVFSWELFTYREERLKLSRPYVLRKFRSIDDPALVATHDLPLAETQGKYGQSAAVDFWADPVTIWISPGRHPLTPPGPRERVTPAGIMLLAEKDGKLELLRDFEADARAAVVQTTAPEANRQRLYFDPKRELLYVGEGSFHFKDAITIDPVTGKTQLVQLPFDAEDMCFDYDGHAYLRTADVLARYEPGTWREVPWDYGEERTRVTYNPHSGRREAQVVSGLALPVNSGWHHGGMHVSPRGNLAVGCLYLYGPADRAPRGQAPVKEGSPFTPKLYPGRMTNAVYGCEYIHVWDRHGRLLHEDAIPGLGTLNGVGIDNDDNLYVLSAATRVRNGKSHFNFLAGTLMKFAPGKGKIVTDDEKVPIPLQAVNRPTRDPDLGNLPGNAWVEGAEWFYGGVGWHGKNHGLGCGCRNTRFALDAFGRSFAPEIDRYSVAVLDPNGNVILRVGQYGNVDDGAPLEKAGGPPSPRSIGGDELSLMHGAYVATQSDRRLFIADIGNYRIASVRLDYHATETVPLPGE
ncbi:MAG: hypothetical protein WD069_20925 [Planctomycetales bacterium]